MNLLGYEFQHMQEDKEKGSEDVFIQRWMSVKPIPYKDVDKVGLLIADLRRQINPLGIVFFNMQMMTDGTSLITEFSVNITIRIRLGKRPR